MPFSVRPAQIGPRPLPSSSTVHIVFESFVYPAYIWECLSSRYIQIYPFLSTLCVISCLRDRVRINIGSTRRSVEARARHCGHAATPITDPGTRRQAASTILPVTASKDYGSATGVDRKTTQYLFTDLFFKSSNHSFLIRFPNFSNFFHQIIHFLIRFSIFS